MRSALAALPVALGLGLASIVACGTFSGAEEAKPAADAGSTDGRADAAQICPTVVEGPGACASDATINLANDPKDCGTCGHSCGAGSCVAGACAPEKVTAEAGLAVALADRFLFLGQPQAVKRFDVDAPDAPVIVAEGFLGDLRGLSPSADTLYLSAAQQQYTVPVAGGTLSPNPKPAENLLPTTGIWFAVPDGSAYYAFVVEKKSHLAHLTTGPLTSIAEEGSISAVTARVSTAFWVVDAPAGSTLRGPFGAPRDLAKSAVTIGAITDDGAHAYYVDTDAHRLMRVDRDGIAVAIAVEPGGPPTAMTMDGDRIVYATVRTEQVVNTFAYVVSVSRCGGPPVVLRKLEKDVTVSSLAASGGVVYAATSAGVERLR